jgi:hypothetical protein
MTGLGTRSGRSQRNHVPLHSRLAVSRAKRNLGCRWSQIRGLPRTRTYQLFH